MSATWRSWRDARTRTWQQVEKLTMFSKPKEYDQATQLLAGLPKLE
jgi:hypothetical protein